MLMNPLDNLFNSFTSNFVKTRKSVQDTVFKVQDSFRTWWNKNLGDLIIHDVDLKDPAKYDNLLQETLNQGESKQVITPNTIIPRKLDYSQAIFENNLSLFTIHKLKNEGYTSDSLDGSFFRHAQLILENSVNKKENRLIDELYHAFPEVQLVKMTASLPKVRFELYSDCLSFFKEIYVDYDFSEKPDCDYGIIPVRVYPLLNQAFFGELYKLYSETE